MKILKHGNMAQRIFTCKYCCCQFVADRSEYTAAASGDNFFVTCPECKSRFDMHAPLYKEESDPYQITEPIEYNNWTHSMYCEWLQKQG